METMIPTEHRGLFEGPIPVTLTTIRHTDFPHSGPVRAIQKCVLPEQIILMRSQESGEHGAAERLGRRRLGLWRRGDDRRLAAGVQLVKRR